MLDEDKYTPLHCAAMKGQIDIVKYLTVEKHCNPLCRDISQNTPLHKAAQKGHIDTVKFLVEELKCPPDIAGYRNLTPLQMAASWNHSDVVRYLQKYSALPYKYTAKKKKRKKGIAI